MSNLIQEVKAALQAATPGPWSSTEDAVRTPQSDTECEWICQMYETDVMQDGDKMFENNDANAHLIANAPTWLQKLIDYAGELEEELNQERSGKEARSDLGQTNP